MVARRVIDDHKDLENVGELTHEELDVHIKETPFMVLSGSEVPPTARVLEAGTGISIVDNGPGSGVVISSEDFVFSQDLAVTLKNGRSFGRFASGELIPAIGKTPAEIILMAINEPIDPTVSLTASNILTSAFNTTGYVGTVLSGNYTINSSNASAVSAVLQYKIGTGSWSTINSDLNNPLGYIHVFDAEPFFTSTINYRYTVIDSQGAGSTASASIVPQAYAAPTTTLSIVRNTNNGIAGESNVKREKGNIGSTITGTITRQRANVPITNYSVQFSVDGAVWDDVPGLSSIAVLNNPASISIPSTSHEDPALLDCSLLYYRIKVTDTYAVSTSSQTTIRFYNVIWFGPSASTPGDSTAIRDLGSKVFTDHSNPFNLETGTTYKNFTVAIPSSINITNVTDLDALNANITSTYIATDISVNNGGGQPESYKSYTMTNAIPYSSNHRHQITRL